MTIDTAAPIRAKIRRVRDAALAYADAALHMRLSGRRRRPEGYPSLCHVQISRDSLRVAFPGKAVVMPAAGTYPAAVTYPRSRERVYSPAAMTAFATLSGTLNTWPAPQQHPTVEQARSERGLESGTNRAHNNDLESYNPRSLRVRRRGLEPRTRGLRVRCYVRLFSLNCCHAMLTRAGSCHFVRLPASASRCGYRVVPARTGASEQTWSKHRSVLV
jgi:hypothetical protein